MTNLSSTYAARIRRQRKVRSSIIAIVAMLAIAGTAYFVVPIIKDAIENRNSTAEEIPDYGTEEGLSLEELRALISSRRAAHKPTTTSSTLTGKEGRTSGEYDDPLDVATPGKFQAGTVGDTEETKNVVVRGEATTESDPVEEEKVRSGHFVRFHSNSGQFEISYQDVVKVLVDGVELSRSAWTIKSNGNLEINLKDYDTNEHVLKVWWDDGSATAKFNGKKDISLQAEEVSESNASESNENEATNDSTASGENSSESSENTDNDSNSSDNSESTTTSEETNAGNETSNDETSEDGGDNSNDPIENGHVEYDPGF